MRSAKSCLAALAPALEPTRGERASRWHHDPPKPAELALINGHSTEDLSTADLEQAQRELTGMSEMHPEQEVLESAPESDRWDPVAGSIGHKVHETFSEDEDDDGRSDSAQLVQQGIDEAEHDQMLQAAKSQAEEDKK